MKTLKKKMRIERNSLDTLYRKRDVERAGAGNCPLRERSRRERALACSHARSHRRNV